MERDFRKNWLFRGQEKAYQLYKKLGECDCENTERVEFALRHWGWTGKEQIGASDAIQKMKDKLFVFPENGERFMKQFYRLRIPIRYGGYGATFFFDPCEWYEDFYESEIMSIQYNVRMVFVGLFLCFYSDPEGKSQSIDFWEKNKAIGYWNLKLFLGRDGKVYYYFVDPCVSGIFAENLVDFFVDMFEFPGAKKKAWSFISEEDAMIDSDLYDEIERQAEAGTYQPREI